jgi:hypothetical protein
MESDTDVYPYTLVQSENDGIFYYNIDNTTAATIISTIDVHYFTFAPETLIPMGYLPRHYKFNRDNRIGLKRRNYLGCKIVGVAFDGGPAWDVTPVGREPKAYVGKGGTTKLT